MENFVSKGVTGYDFPELLANDGELLASEVSAGHVDTPASFFSPSPLPRH